VLDRIKREQLDGAIGSESCVRLGPSLKVTRIFGLFQSREESFYILGRLLPTLDQEFLRNGFVNLGEATLGPELLFTREPVRDMAELRKTLLWVWEDDAELRTQAPALGLRIVATPLEGGARAYDDKSVDGFIAMPTAALAFQWSTRTRYLTSLRAGHLNGCILVANRAFDRLPIEQQQVLRASFVKLAVRFEDISQREDEALVGELFARQGLTVAAPSPELRTDFFAAAAKARASLGEAIVPRAVLERVLKALAEVRAK
jgi:TRAP-type C4-dicarboxylate transport system substrate-binding protein